MMQYPRNEPYLHTCLSGWRRRPEQTGVHLGNAQQAEAGPGEAQGHRRYQPHICNLLLRSREDQAVESCSSLKPEYAPIFHSNDKRGTNILLGRTILISVIYSWVADKIKQYSFVNF